jgi:hypothetical protein
VLGSKTPSGKRGGRRPTRKIAPKAGDLQAVVVEGFAGITRGQIGVVFKSARPGHACVPTADNRGLATGPTACNRQHRPPDGEQKLSSSSSTSSIKMLVAYTEAS